MITEQLKEEYARRPYKARCVKTGETIGFNTLVDLRDALSDGNVVRINEVGAPDPTRNYTGKTTDEIRKLCQVRNVQGFLTMSREQQIKALVKLDARDDADLVRARKPGAPMGEAAPVEAQTPEAALTELKALADRVGVKYAPNISAAKLQQRLNEANTAAKAAVGTKPGAPLE